MNLPRLLELCGTLPDAQFELISCIAYCSLGSRAADKVPADRNHCKANEPARENPPPTMTIWRWWNCGGSAVRAP